jgi:sulfatase modifying factor 1
MASFAWQFPYLTNTKPDRETRSHRHAVGSFAPNALGIYDMHGNVLEWCADYDPKVYQDDDRKDPKGPVRGDQRVLRGGSYLSWGVNCRAAARYAEAPGIRGPHIALQRVCEVRK